MGRLVPSRTGCDVTWIHLANSDLHGSLAKEFRELRALERLELDDKNVTGDLDVLKENTALTHLDLRNTQVSGNLQSLAKATALKSLWLRGTQVSGELVGLSNANGLQYLGLSKTKVSGDVVALRNAMGLERLELSETKVSGEIAALANATGLQYLYLSETRVHGNLNSLAKLTELISLELYNTKISGDLSVILQWKRIFDLGLSGTKVTSHPTEDFKDCCKNLKALELARTEVGIMDGFLPRFKPLEKGDERVWNPAWNCPFPALKTLDMTGTPLNTTVGKLLRPFVGCQKLRIFKAAECSLTGPMPFELPVWWGGRSTSYYPMYNWPLSKVLQLLDLSSNNVTKVEALPENCWSVSFRDNPQISFGKDVVKKATDHFVSLDLRNTSFAHPSDARSSKDFSTVFSK